MKTLLALLIVICGIFGRRHRAQPPQRPAPQPAASSAAGHWEYVPHMKDGYWVEYVYSNSNPPKLIPAKDLPSREIGYSYPFNRYVWEWQGYKLGDATVCIEDFPGKTLDKPKSPYWIPDYDPFMPGQRDNL